MQEFFYYGIIESYKFIKYGNIYQNTSEVWGISIEILNSENGNIKTKIYFRCILTHYQKQNTQQSMSIFHAHTYLHTFLLSAALFISCFSKALLFCIASKTRKALRSIQSKRSEKECVSICILTQL